MTVTLKLTDLEAEAVEYALDCEIPTRRAAAYDDCRSRNDVPRGQGAIDDSVPGMERALTKLRAARDAR